MVNVFIISLPDVFLNHILYKIPTRKFTSCRLKQLSKCTFRPQQGHLGTSFSIIPIRAWDWVCCWIKTIFCISWTCFCCCCCFSIMVLNICAILSFSCFCCACCCSSMDLNICLCLVWRACNCSFSCFFNSISWLFSWDLQLLFLWDIQLLHFHFSCSSLLCYFLLLISGFEFFPLFPSPFLAYPLPFSCLPLAFPCSHQLPPASQCQLTPP